MIVSHHFNQRHGFTQIELLVMISTISMPLPVLSSARDAMQNTAPLGNPRKTQGFRAASIDDFNDRSSMSCMTTSRTMGLIQRTVGCRIYNDWH